MTEEERGASESEAEVEIDRRLDQSLETKSRQHNLTTVNVKNIIHVSARARRPRPQRRRCRTQLALWSTGGDHQRARGSHDEGCHQPNRGGAAVRKCPTAGRKEPGRRLTLSCPLGAQDDPVQVEGGGGERGGESAGSLHACVGGCVGGCSSHMCSFTLFCQVIPAWNISPIKKSGDVRKVRSSTVLFRFLRSGPRVQIGLDPRSRPDWSRSVWISSISWLSVTETLLPRLVFVFSLLSLWTSCWLKKTPLMKSTALMRRTKMKRLKT